MSLQTIPHQSQDLQVFNYEQAQSAKNNMLWRGLADRTIEQELNLFLNQLENRNTRLTYAKRFNSLFRRGLLNPTTTLDTLALMNLDNVLDRITNTGFACEAAKQLHASAFISFTNYLCRKTEGMIKKAQPNRFGNTKTFCKIRDKVVTPAIPTREEWDKFLIELTKSNKVIGLIGKLLLQGGRRISEVLELNINDIDFNTNEIKYKIKKKKKTESFAFVYIRNEILLEIKAYIGDRTNGLVFVSKLGNPLCYQHILKHFTRAGIKANMPWKMRTHIMRTTMITYHKSIGTSDSDIMKITGHESMGILRSYDKTDPADNMTRRISLI